MNLDLRAYLATLVLVSASLLLGGCTTSHFEPAEVQGPPAMIDDGGKPRLWVLSKQEEQRQVGVGGGGVRNSVHWRTDTFFHFSVQAFDPVAAKSLWTKRLVSLGDPEAKGVGPSRVIGSSVDAQMLGQDGVLVWLLIGDAPFAVNAADGEVVADSASLQKANPELQGLLPSEARHYGFDQGLVFLAADARQFVVRGPGQKAAPYTPPPPPAAPQGRLKANGTYELVPMLPIGENAVRQVTLDGQWLGLYSEKEAADAADDDWGKSLRYPYSVINEGSLARRTFWRGKIVQAQRFDDKFERLADLAPVAGSPTFLKGRFVADPNGEAHVLADPAGVLVLHSTRIDDAGRLALARVGADLKPKWDTELPLSETDFVRRLPHWLLAGHFIAVGTLQTEDAGVTRRAPQLISVDLASGELRSLDLAKASSTH
jgi:hypothetical protein